MIIDVSEIPASKNPNAIENFIKKEIKAGKLSSLKIDSIKVQLSTKDGEYSGTMWLSGESEFPKLFTILAYDKEPEEWLFKLPIVQINREIK